MTSLSSSPHRHTQAVQEIAAADAVYCLQACACAFMMQSEERRSRALQPYIVSTPKRGIIGNSKYADRLRRQVRGFECTHGGQLQQVARWQHVIWRLCRQALC